MHRLLPIALLGLALLLWSCGSADEMPDAEEYYNLVGKFSSATIGAEESAPGPAAEPGSGLLFLPAGTRVDYLLFIEPKTQLRAEEIILKGVGSRLTIVLETDSEAEREVAALRESQKDLAVAMRGHARTPVRLSLQAQADDLEPGSGVMLEQPALWAPAAVPDELPPIVDLPGRRPNVLIYLVDTLRADRLGSYGYPKPVSPNIDRFAASSSLFVNAIGQSSWTKASVASIFTGLWPPAHGAIGWKHKLSDETVTLAELLQAEGYRTAAFVTNPNVVKAFGFTQGFDDFVRKLKIPSDRVNAMVFDWFDGKQEDSPFLLYIHTMDPHAPYAPPEPFRTEFAPQVDQMPSWQPRWRWPMEALPYLSSLYDAEIAFNDDSFGKLLDFLEEQELFDDTLIIFASDHGEEFKEHGRWRHGANLHAETLNFPLIVKFPGQRDGTRIEQAVQHIDLLPTILNSTGLAIPTGLEGRDLGLIARAEASVTRPVPSSIYSHLRLGRSPLYHSLVTGQWKLIRRQAEEGWEVSLFDWQQDPRETNDLAGEKPVLAAVLSAMIDQELASLQESEAVEEITLSEELEEDLRALGYLE